MFLIIGYVIILAAALGTYAVHGSLLALWVPTEYIAIIGLVIGYFVASNDIKIIKGTIAAVPGILKGSKFTKAFYIDTLAMLFEILGKVRKEGLMSIEAMSRIRTPVQSSASIRIWCMTTTSWSLLLTTCA